MLAKIASDLVYTKTLGRTMQIFDHGHQQHPIDTDDGRFDTDKPLRNINKNTMLSSTATDVLQRLHWETIAS